MQLASSQSYQCPRCPAKPGEPCITVHGDVAEKVHYGRPAPPALSRAKANLESSSLRPTASGTGIWIGSEYAGRGESVPYGAWYCPCGEHREALGLADVLEMNDRYAGHAACRG